MTTTTVKPLSPMQQKLLKLVLKPVSYFNTWLYRTSGGKLGGKAAGAPVMLLITTGRKSGQPRTAPLLYLEDGEDIVVVASQGGMSEDPLWFKNLEANPEAEIEIGKEKRKVRARRATDEEKATHWPKVTGLYSGFDLYQARTERNIPVVILSPTE